MHALLLMMVIAVRIYVADSGENKITVIDPGKQPGTIAVSPNPQGIAAFPDARRLYVSSGSANVLDVVDTRIGKLTRSVPVGPRPGSIAITPDGRRIYVCIGGRPAVEIVDTASLTKTNSIETGAPPQVISVTPDQTRMLVGSAGRISVINIRTEEVEFEIPLAGNPASMAIDSDRHLVIHRLLIRMAGAEGFEILDYASRKITGKIALPGANVLATSVDHRTLWVSAGDSVTIFSLPDLKRLVTVPVGAGADAIVFTPDGKHCFVSSTGADSVAEIDTATYKEIAHFPAGRAPKQMIAAP
jgi:YVTN family beta-propeller protein